MSSTRQFPSAATRMAHARAADANKLRSEILADTPGLSEADLQARVDIVLRARRSAGGRKGAERTAARSAAARAVLAVVPDLIADTEAHLDRLRQLATLAEDVA